MLSKEFEDLFKCFICMDVISKPLLCPDCSKLACQHCFQKWVQSNGHCPHCRSSVTTQQLIKIDWAADVLQCWQQVRSTDGNQCTKHCIPKDYWCHVCKEVGCADCFLLGSDHDSHEIAKSNAVHQALLNHYRTNDIKYFEDQRSYWVRYRNDISRQLEMFNVECLHKRNNEEQLFNIFLQDDQSTEVYVNNTYYADCLKKAEEQIALYTRALESGEKFLNELPIDTLLQDSQKYFAHAHNIVHKICDEAERKDGGNQKLKLWLDDRPYITTFTITDFSRFSSGGDIKISPVTRFSGSLWRLKVYTYQNEKTNSLYLSIFVELYQGLPGEYEYKLQLLETIDEFSSVPSLTKTYKSHFEKTECWGYQKFIKLDDRFKSLYYDHSKDSISLIYSVRPTTYYQKCLDLQNYVHILEQKTNNSSLDPNHVAHTEDEPIENVSEVLSELVGRPLEDIPPDTRESQLTLADEPGGSFSNDISQQIEEIERIVEKTGLDSPSPSSSVYESSTEAANTILHRLLSTKLEKTPSLTDSQDDRKEL